MTFYRFLVVTNELNRPFLFGLISVLSFAFSPYVAALWVSGMFFMTCFLYVIREEYMRYKNIAWPVFEIYKELTSNRDKIIVTDKLAVYISDTGQKIEYSRYVPGEILNPEINAFSPTEKAIIESAFRDAVIAYDNSNSIEKQKEIDKKQKLRDTEREKFASILNINRDSNEQKDQL